MTRGNNPLFILFVSETCAFAFAIVYVIVFTLTLRPSDGAYGQAPFADPFVFPIMSVFAIVAGLIAWPFMHFVLQNRRVWK